MLKRLYHWMELQVHHRYATPFLGALFFIEAIFFVPVDPVLMVYCLKRQQRALYYGAIATIASVAGGVAGYYIGYGIWETVGTWLVTHLLGERVFNSVLHYFRTYQMWTILIGGFTPIPYKAITLGAGFCQIPLIPFIIYSFIARGARFFMVAGAIHMWGEKIRDYIDRYFNLLVLLFTVLIFGTLLILKLVC